MHKPGASEPGYQIAGIPGAKPWMPNVTLLATAAHISDMESFSENEIPLNPLGYHHFSC